MNSRAVIRFEKAGFAVVPDILDEDEVCEISRQLEFLGTANAGTRRLLNEPWCRGLGQRLARDIRLSNLIPHDACAVQCTYFTKSSTHNWLVTLHQDLSIPVADRIDSEHCSGWSRKEGGLFVQPPSSFLEDILAVRIHLDDTNDESGALRIVPGSHALGRLTAEAIQRVRDELGEVTVPVLRGGAMVMRPLLLHASHKVCVDRPRRVLHFAYGPSNLPCGLRWPPSDGISDGTVIPA
jgi:ectoine hydroxylase-related dioxygenase (phytanoyl-CoA dioxygenase family)